MALHNEIGKKGEKLAVDYLINKGYRIHCLNYSYRKAEIDIIAQINKQLVIVEVKTRSKIDFGLPHEFIDQKKIERLVKAADHYVRMTDLSLEVRFDVISVYKVDQKIRIEHLKEAFYHF